MVLGMGNSVGFVRVPAWQAGHYSGLVEYLTGPWQTLSPPLRVTLGKVVDTFFLLDYFSVLSP